METKKVVEALLFNSKNREHIYKVLKTCRIINDTDRNWEACEHLEIDSLIFKFNKPVCVCSIFSNIICFLIEPIPRKRLYSVMMINGKNTQFLNLSKSSLINVILSNISIKDFVPPNYLNQIYWIPYEEKNKINETAYDIGSNLLDNLERSSSNESESIEIIVFSEYLNNVWTIDLDIEKAEQNTGMKTTPKQIIQNILKEV